MRIGPLGQRGDRADDFAALDAIMTVEINIGERGPLAMRREGENQPGWICGFNRRAAAVPRNDHKNECSEPGAPTVATRTKHETEIWSTDKCACRASSKGTSCAMIICFLETRRVRRTWRGRSQ